MDPATAMATQAAIGELSGSLTGTGGSATNGDFNGGTFATGAFKTERDNSLYMYGLAGLAIIAYFVVNKK